MLVQTSDLCFDSNSFVGRLMFSKGSDFTLVELLESLNSENGFKQTSLRSENGHLDFYKRYISREIKKHEEGSYLHVFLKKIQILLAHTISQKSNSNYLNKGSVGFNEEKSTKLARLKATIRSLIVNYNVAIATGVLIEAA